MNPSSAHDDHGLQWPEPAAPFGLLNLKIGEKWAETIAESLYRTLCQKGVEVLYDGQAGAKFADMYLIGLPWQVAVGARSLDGGTVEVKNRRTGTR